MTVELIYDRDCPNAAAARANLAKALAASGQKVEWTEWDRSDPDSPTRVRGFGSPTILAAGRDVAGDGYGTGNPTCRLYVDEAGIFVGVPSVEQIMAALESQSSGSVGSARAASGWRSSLAAAPGIAFAFLPNLVCPACWPAYAGLLSSIGLGFLLDWRYLLPVTAVFLALALGALAFRARGRRGYRPFAVGLAAAAVVLAGKFAFGSSAAMYGGIAGLVAASIWNAWPQRAVSVSCTACGPASS